MTTHYTLWSSHRPRQNLRRDTRGRRRGPGGEPGLAPRRAGAQRGRQEDHDPHARHVDRPGLGSARVLGHDIVKEAAAVRGAVSLTGQPASVDQDLTGRENLVLLGRLLGLMLGGWPRSVPMKSARTALRSFPGRGPAGEELLGGHPALAGHPRQHLAVATPKAPRPSDEPTTKPTRALSTRRGRTSVPWWRGHARLRLGPQYLEEADQLGGTASP